MKRALLALSLLGIFIVELRPARAAGHVLAQETEFHWSEPVRLTSVDAVVQHSTIAGDPWGGVHVIWTSVQESDQPTNLIYYTYSRDEGLWSPVHDVFAGADWDAYRFPYARCGDDGQLRLVWSGAEGVYYSSVRAQDSGDIRQWRHPQLVARATSAGRARFAQDPSGALHLVYASRTPGSNLMYTRAGANDVLWTDPVPISALTPSDPQAVDYAQIAVGQQDSLHVVWAEVYPTAWTGGQVYYARSDDDGNSWTAPIALSEFDENWATNTELVVDSSGTMYVIWVCGRAGRCTTFSTDGGSTWSSTGTLFDGLIGRSGWDSVASDRYGNVYWFGALREPQAQYISVHTYQGWGAPKPLSNQSGWGRLRESHFPNLIVRSGNTLHITLVEGDKGPLWYVRGQTPFPAVPSAPAPTSVRDAVLEAQTLPETRPAQQSTATPTTYSTTAAPLSRRSSAPLIYGFSAALLLVASVALVVLSHHTIRK